MMYREEGNKTVELGGKKSFLLQSKRRRLVRASILKGKIATGKIGESAESIYREGKSHRKTEKETWVS